MERKDLPDLVIVFRHCDKLKPCKGTSKYPKCCTGSSPPQSCDDCSPQGYMRSLGLTSSLHSLLAQIANGDSITNIYAASSKDIISRCPSSRRTWELLVPTASQLNLPINTMHCATDHVQTAKDILSNDKGIVIAAWEHTNIAALVGWIMALAENPKANKPIGGFPKWYGNVFDQYWVIDLRGNKPTFSIYPERILPTDCPYARERDGKCPGAFATEMDMELEGGMGDARPNSNCIYVILILVILLGLWIVYHK